MPLIRLAPVRMIRPDDAERRLPAARSVLPRFWRARSVPYENMGPGRPETEKFKNQLNKNEGTDGEEDPGLSLEGDRRDQRQDQRREDRDVWWQTQHDKAPQRKETLKKVAVTSAKVTAVALNPTLAVPLVVNSLSSRPFPSRVDSRRPPLPRAESPVQVASPAPNAPTPMASSAPTTPSGSVPGKQKPTQPSAELVPLSQETTPVPSHPRRFSRAAGLGSHLQIQAAEGFRAATVEVHPGMWLVVEVPQEVVNRSAREGGHLGRQLLQTAAQVFSRMVTPVVPTSPALPQGAGVQLFNTALQAVAQMAGDPVPPSNWAPIYGVKYPSPEEAQGLALAGTPCRQPAYGIDPSTYSPCRCRSGGHDVG